ncbi:TCP-1/cpn60 chaperonin family protein, partial [Methanosarcina horonobensis]|uniref:TCP-1/cpn60 chaperonin family protein n=1 Tax=Methanosarcina horonobensis TaxID=418008 RepID=UPI002FCDEA34
LESQDGMAKLARTIRDKILIDEPVKEEGLIDQLERASIEIDELLGSSLGPKGMNKIIVNPVGDIFVTSDGKVILKEMDVLHPLVTSLKKLAESMDKACGDGTKTAVIFASNLIKKRCQTDKGRSASDNRYRRIRTCHAKSLRDVAVQHKAGI